MFTDPATEGLHNKEYAILAEVAKPFGRTVDTDGFPGKLWGHQIEMEYALSGGGSQPIKVLGSCRPISDAELRQHYIDQIRRELRK